MDDGQNEFCAKKGAEGERERPHGTVRALIGRVAVCSAPLQMGKEIDCQNILHFDGAERSLDAGWRLICAQIAVIMFPKKGRPSRVGLVRASFNLVCERETS